jgi:hypothetical protein
MYGIDVKEDDLLGLGNGILDTLLLDRTTGENIIWATDDYAPMGDAYTFFQHITPELITGEHKNVIQPRVAKSEEERKLRARKMAEVFTPSWICNNMNNGVDERWFNRKPVFNIVTTEKGKHLWTPTAEKVEFPEGKTWQEYVSMGVIEITCGEAPFLASRYDTVTGEAITDLSKRIGWLDRKLRYYFTTMTKYSDFIKQGNDVCYNGRKVMTDEVLDYSFEEIPTKAELDENPNLFYAGIVYENQSTETVSITKFVPQGQFLLWRSREHFRC